jgi:hypothetical protein
MERHHTIDADHLHDDWIVCSAFDTDSVTGSWVVYTNQETKVVEDQTEIRTFIREAQEGVGAPVDDVRGFTYTELSGNPSELVLKIAFGMKPKIHVNKKMRDILSGVLMDCGDDIETMIHRGNVWMWIAKTPDASESTIIAARKHGILAMIKHVIVAHNKKVRTVTHVLVDFAHSDRISRRNGGTGGRFVNGMEGKVYQFVRYVVCTDKMRKGLCESESFVYIV